MSEKLFKLQGEFIEKFPADFMEAVRRQAGKKKWRSKIHVKFYETLRERSAGAS